ncbi:MAG TPA: hypothetical protein VHV57_06030 [Acidimicrobiales bacterium]|jgi:hypothetical protein|nr:hypothetical protein [Acidimicrobiales bacterium]
MVNRLLKARTPYRDKPRSQKWMWCLPLVVAFLGLALTQKRAIDLMGVCVALLLFAFLVNRPGGALIALVIILPLESIVFGLLYGLHVPAGFLHPLSAYKELLAGVILVAGLRHIRDTGKKLDRIDIALLLYVGVVTIYLIVPHLFSIYAPNQWSPRFLAYRSDVGYVLIFFGARHAPISPRVKDRFLQVVLGMGAFAAAVGLYQRIAPASFANFVINTAHVATYQTNVLGLDPTVAARNLVYVTTLNPLHITSIFLSPYDFGDYLDIVVAVAAVRIAQNRRSPFNYIVLAASMACLYFTQSRSNGIAAAIILVLIALPTARSPVEGRLRLIGALLVAAVLVVPSLSGSRYIGNASANQSSQGHIFEIEDGLGIIYYVPLGLGLGQQPGVANRFAGLSSLINDGDVSDNLITQVADELGLQALLPWLFMMGFILWEFKRRGGLGDEFAAIAGFGFLAIVIAGQYHHVFLTFPVPWTLWAGAGLALSVVEPGSIREKTSSASSYPAWAGVR